MAKSRFKRLSLKEKTIICFIILVVVAIAFAVAYFTGTIDTLVAILNGENPDFSSPGDSDLSNPGNSDATGNQVPIVIPEGEMQIHFIDVGQADCILVSTGGESMLIDTGELDDDYTQKIITYLKERNIDVIDYLLLTHPDADHIGGAPEIIKEFKINKCIMPNYAKTSNIYKNTLLALSSNDVEVLPPTPGDVFNVGEAVCKVLAPLKSYDDANEVSVVIRLDFGKTSVLLTGDAEKESEADMVARYSEKELDVDILKSGHHGSKTSSSQGLLDKATPEWAIISCGEGNTYGHPNDETIERYEENNIKYYRTDIHGTVILTTDGESFSFTKEK